MSPPDAHAGVRRSVRDLSSPAFASIDCLFNHQQLLANRQTDNSPAGISWQLHDSRAWMPLDMSHPALRQPLDRWEGSSLRQQNLLLDGPVLSQVAGVAW